MNKYLQSEIKLLEKYAKDVKEIHKLASILTQFCESKQNSDELYEVSGISLLIENMLDKLGYDIYQNIHKYDEPLTKEELAERIAALREMRKTK